MNIRALTQIFHIDILSVIMIFLVFLIGATVLSFSTRYMKGDSDYHSFMLKLFLLIIFLGLIGCTDNLFLLLSFFSISNFLLIKLMAHESEWGAAKASAKLAAKTFLFGFICISIGFYFLYLSTHSISIHKIINTKNTSNYITIGLILISIGAMTQSGLWPFHRWLISSLNSPTPVSAIMHAGLVNGGGFLLARFSPLYLKHPTILDALFLAGIYSAIIGTAWKLIQNDIKRMLACSTMGQMGFMFAQCGAGLFPAAIAHLCFHGFFKANLFLSSSGVINEKKEVIKNQLKLSSFFIALSFSFIGSLIFSMINHIQFHLYQTNIILVVLFIIACTQCCIVLINKNTIQNITTSLLFSIIFGLCYGFTLKITRNILHIDFSYIPPDMNIIYTTGLVALVICWLLFIFYPLIKNKIFISEKIKPYLYMKNLNASQPDPKTITINRNDYSYK